MNLKKYILDFFDKNASFHSICFIVDINNIKTQHNIVYKNKENKNINIIAAQYKVA